MSIEHLHYALKEIDTVSQLLSIKNSTFFKRALARLIAIRIDDFIKLAFAVNKQTQKLKLVRDELNALEALYKEHFKLQRDKYGAHFQHLDFGIRLQNWSEINADKASFFTEMPREIYTHFNQVSGYIPYSEVTLGVYTVNAIEEVNKHFDLEGQPNLSTDILALTRPNSGGVLNFSMIHTKAGVLKSLELLIDYELAQIDKLATHNDLRIPFIKLFVTDLLSYVDNYFTRTDITSSASQFEEGFDYYVAEKTNEGTEKAHEIITEFKAHFTLSQHIADLRTIRNKACGHIDTTYTVVQLDAMINAIDLSRFRSFYLRLKAIFRSICYSTIYLKQYLIDPFEPLHGVEKMVGLEVSSFDGQAFPETPRRYKSPNDDEEYERSYQRWLISPDDAIRSYFWNCFIDSDIIDHIQVAIDSPTGGQSYRYHSYRKAHKFFEDKLTSNNISPIEKLAIIDLFLRCGTGDPETLAFILERTYPADFNLRVHYIHGLGELSGHRSALTLQRCADIFTNCNLQGKCLALRAVFGIDLTARRSSTGKHNADVSNYSTYIKSVFNARITPFEKLSLALMLASDYVFGKHHLSDSLDVFYREFLNEAFVKGTNQMLSSFPSIGDNRKRLMEIQELFSTNRFCTLAGMFSDFIEEKGFNEQAKILRLLVAQEYIQCAKEDNQELHNLAVIYFKVGDLNTAISIAKFLTEKNAHIVDDNYLLLDLYRHDEKYKADFLALKNNILQTFNLSEAEREDFEAIHMGDATNP